VLVVALSVGVLSLAPSEVHATAVDTAAAPRKLGLVSAYRALAMMPLSSLGSTEEASQAIERVLVGEFKKLLGDRLIAPNELLSRGDVARGAFLECEGLVVCLVEVIGGLGWDAFVVGNIAGLGNDQVINLKLIDVRTGGEVRRASEPVSGDETQLIAKMRKAAVTLLAPELLVGTLDVRCPQANVRILVDGVLAGTTPLAGSRIEVPVGRHAIEANGEGLVPFSKLVDVQYDESVTLSIELPSNALYVGGSALFRQQWWTWALAGTGGLVTGVGGYFNYLQTTTVDRIERRAKAGTLTQEHADLFDEEKANWRRALTFYGVGGTMLLSVGVLYLVDLL